jgi:hypothetical protein
MEEWEIGEEDDLDGDGSFEGSSADDVTGKDNEDDVEDGDFEDDEYVNLVVHIVQNASASVSSLILRSLTPDEINLITEMVDAMSTGKIVLGSPQCHDHEFWCTYVRSMLEVDHQRKLVDEEEIILEETVRLILSSAMFDVHSGEIIEIDDESDDGEVNPLQLRKYSSNEVIIIDDDDENDNDNNNDGRSKDEST